MNEELESVGNSRMPCPPSIHSTARLAAQFIRQNQEPIIDAWLDQSPSLSASMNEETLAAFADHLPDFLHELVANLDQEPKPAQAPEQSLRCPAGSLIPGYRQLYQILSEQLEASDQASPKVLAVLFNAIMDRIAAASVPEPDPQPHEKEQLWVQSILNRLPIAVVLTDLKTSDAIYSNPERHRVIKHYPRRLLPHGEDECYATDSRGKRIPRDQMPRFRVSRGESIRGMEMTWHTPEESTPVMVYGDSLPACHGHQAIGVLTFLDISDWKKAEKLQTKMLENILNHTPTPIVLLEGPEHRFRYANKMYQESFVRDPDFIGKTASEVLPEAKTQGFIDLLDKVYHTGEPQTGTEAVFEHLAPDGRTVLSYLNFTYAPLRRADGSIEGVIATIHDVTEQVHARQRVEASESKVRLYAEAMPQMAFIADADGSIVFYNQRHYDYFGATPEEHQGWGWETKKPAIHPDDAARTVKTWKEALRTGEPYEIEYRLRRHDGEYRWHLGRAVPERDAQGHITEWFGSNTDIHEAYVAGERSKASEERLKFAMRAGSMGAWTVDLTNSAVTLSEEARQLFGLPEKNLDVDATIDAAIHPDDRERARSELENALKAGSLYQSSYRIIRADSGEIRWILATGMLYSDAIGATHLLSGVIIDITERKAYEKTLRDVLDHMPLLAGLLDADGIVRFINQTAIDMQRQDDRGLIGRRADQIAIWGTLPESRQAIDQALHAAKNGRMTRLDLQFVAQSGDAAEVRWGDFRIAPLFDERSHVTGILATGSDITDRKMLERGWLEAKEAAESANEAKSAFLANMSHEIRTPLGAIIGFADLALQTDASQDDTRSYLRIIEKNSVQLIRIIDDILDLAKVEAGRVELEQMEVPLAEFLADFSSVWGFRAREKGIEFRMAASTDLPEKIGTDPTRLRQILTNAVGNAIKFTSRGFVDLSVSWADDQLAFTIEDSGRGIAKEQLVHLFQPFVQADSSTTRQFGGTGLGLVLSKRLCQLLGGDYVLDHSELDRGSRFTATIRPRIPAATIMLPKASIKFQTSPVAGVAVERRKLEHIQVLLAEDSPDNQILVTRILTKQGAQVTLAPDGAQAVAKALTQSFDVVLMDIQMPNMDGHEATRTLRAKGYQGPIVALTAHAMKEESERAMESGFTTFLTKPIQREALVSTVADLARPQP